MGAGKSRSCRLVLAAGVAAGVSATLVQLVLWTVAGDDALALLLRDARLTATLVLGQAVLSPPAGFDAAIMLAATLIHFVLSLVYAAMLAPLAGRLALAPSLLVGAGFGGALYAINLHGFTWLFPWFVQARGWVTLAAHLAFGLTIMGVYIIGGRRRPAVR